jgi:hypothetical protein
MEVIFETSMAKNYKRIIYFASTGAGNSSQIGDAYKNNIKAVIASKAKLFPNYKSIAVVNGGGQLQDNMAADNDLKRLEINPVTGELICQQAPIIYTSSM